MEEQQEANPLSDARKEAMVNDLMLVMKSAMAKASNREQMWCDILATGEKHIRRVIEENTR